MYPNTTRITLGGNRSSYYSFLHSWRSSHQNYMVPGPGDSERFLYVFSEVYEPFGAPLEKMMPPLWYSMDSISELAQIYATLDEFVYESAVAFITGTKGHRQRLGLLPGRVARHRRGALPGDYPGGVRQQRVRQVNGDGCGARVAEALLSPRGPLFM